MDETTQNPQGQGGEPRNGQDQGGLRELALRLAAAPSPYMPPTEREPQLFIAQLPPDLPAELALPQGSRIVGSVVGRATVIYLDADLPAKAVLDFYRERLTAAGWSEPQLPGMRHGGFVPSFFPPAYQVLLCKSEQGPGLTVIAYDTPGKPTDVRVELNTYEENPEQSPCAQQRRMRERLGRPMWNIFPDLVPPPGSQQQPQGGGGGGDRWYTSAALRSSLALGEIRTHYERQLQDAAWTSTASGESGPVAWSTWTFSDEEGESWRGLFFALREPDEPNAYYLHLQAKPRDSQRRGGFSVAHSSMTLRTGSHP